LSSKIEAEIILGDNLGSPKWHPRQIANEKSSSCQAIFGAIALTTANPALMRSLALDTVHEKKKCGLFVLRCDKYFAGLLPTPISTTADATEPIINGP